MPARPALLKEVLSVPPTARLVEGTAPATPRSSKGASAARTTAAASGGPKTLAPRTRPVPESMLK